MEILKIEPSRLILGYLKESKVVSKENTLVNISNAVGLNTCMNHDIAHMSM
jgi:hypothetical protein